ncbi:MAG: hypothetical protein RRZ92_03465 [Bacilli bacterium]
MDVKEHKFKIGDAVVLKERDPSWNEEDVIEMIVGYVEDPKLTYISDRKRAELLESNYEYVIEFVGCDCGWGTLSNRQYVKESQICKCKYNSIEDYEDWEFVEDAREILRKRENSNNK